MSVGIVNLSKAPSICQYGNGWKCLPYYIILSQTIQTSPKNILIIMNPRRATENKLYERPKFWADYDWFFNDLYNTPQCVVIQQTNPSNSHWNHCIRIGVYLIRTTHTPIKCLSNRVHLISQNGISANSRHRTSQSARITHWLPAPRDSALRFVTIAVHYFCAVLHVHFCASFSLLLTASLIGCFCYRVLPVLSARWGSLQTPRTQNSAVCC